MTLAVLAAAAYAGIIVWACLLSTNVLALTIVLGVIGAGQLVLVLLRGHEELLGPALLFAGCAYVLGLLVGRHALDEGAPLVAAGLLLCGELTTWSIDERLPIAHERRVRGARAAGVGALGPGGLVTAGVVVAGSAAAPGGGIGWTLLGAAAAVVALGIAARSALRS